MSLKNHFAVLKGIYLVIVLYLHQFPFVYYEIQFWQNCSLQISAKETVPTGVEYNGTPMELCPLGIHRFSLLLLSSHCSLKTVTSFSYKTSICPTRKEILNDDSAALCPVWKYRFIAFFVCSSIDTKLASTRSPRVFSVLWILAFNAICASIRTSHFIFGHNIIFKKHCLRVFSVTREAFRPSQGASTCSPEINRFVLQKQSLRFLFSLFPKIAFVPFSKSSQIYFTQSIQIWQHEEQCWK